MTTGPEPSNSNDTVDLPRPRVAKSRWPFPIVWIVPLLAAGVLAFYLYRYHSQRGIEIQIVLDDAQGLRVRDTPLNYHGVRVGSVSRIELDEEHEHAVVFVRLEKRYEHTVARNGSQFWLVRPDISAGMISGLDTVISGPFIECSPGGGDAVTKFIGNDSKPVLLGDGLRVVLTTDRLSHLQIDSPVYFRGLQVGAVQDIRFSGDATGVNVTLFIWERYAKLLRKSSRFWSVTGTDIRGGVLSGISVQVNNIKALFAGGVAFATPEGDESRVAEGSRFTLHEAADKEWLEWSAKIDLSAKDNTGQPKSDPVPKP